MSNDHFRARIVLISALGEDGCESKPFGMGVLLSDTLVLTCAHVVAEALGHNPVAPDRPRRGVLVRPAIARRGDGAEVATATVAERGWFPKKSTRRHDEPADIALLVVATGQLMTGAVPPLSLAVALSPSGAEGRLLGVSSTRGKEGRDRAVELVPIHGIVGDAKGDGFYAFERDAPTGYWIEPGCSGAPVCTSVNSTNLLGIIVQEEIDETVGMAFMIPSRDIKAALTLAGISLAASGTSELALVMTWAASAFGAATSEADKIRPFVELYSGCRSTPAPFVGRGHELALIDQLVDSGTGICFIGGRAGMGKSALMLHAAAAILRDRPFVRLLILPISLRFGTADQLAGLPVLAAQLQAQFPSLRESDDQGALAVIAAGWEAIRSHYLDRFVLLVDGVDEAIGAWIQDGVLPLELPSNLVVIASGRTPTPEVDIPSWMQLRSPSGRLDARPLPLKPLPIAAVAEAISQLGYSFHTRPDRKGMLKEFYKLTDHGDPLLVGLWASLLVSNLGHPDEALSIASLRRLRPGISGYLDEWFRQQKTVWKALGLRRERREFEPLLHLLAVAEGPMSADDICRLLASNESTGAWTADAIESSLSSSWRILADTGGQTYTFVHPRIRYHYADQLEKTHDLDNLRSDFVAWGRREIASLRREHAAASFSAYVLEHHCSHIQAAAGGLASDELFDAVEEVLQCAHWPRFCLNRHGTYGRYVADLRSLDGILAKCDEPRAEPARLLCQLSLKSISSIGERIPPAVLAALLTSRAWSASRVQVYVKSIYSDRRRFAALADILPYAADAARRALINDLLFEAPPATDPRGRVAALARLLDYDFERREVVISDAWACALSVPEALGRATSISLVARFLPPDERVRQLEEAVKWAAEISEELARAAVLAKIVAACDADERPLRSVATQLERLELRSSFERVLRCFLTNRVLSLSLWHRLFSIVRQREDQALVTTCIVALVDVGPEPATSAKLAVSYAAEILDSMLKVEYQVELCRHTPGLHHALLGTITQSLEKLVPDVRVARILARLSNLSKQGAAHRARAVEILSRAPGGPDYDQAALALLETTAGHEDLAKRCIDLVSTITRIDALEEFTARLAVQLRTREAQDQLLERIRSLQGRARIARTLTAVARVIQDRLDSLLVEAIEHASAVEDIPTQCAVLCDVARGLGEAQRQHVLQLAVRCAAHIGDREVRISNLGKIAGECTDLPEVAEEVFEAAKTIDDQAEACRALISIAARRSTEHRTAEIERILRFVPTIRDEGERAARLSEAARFLLVEQAHFHMLLEAIGNIASEVHRGEALVHLSMQLDRFPACAVPFIGAIGSLVHTGHLARIYQQIYARLGDRRDVLQIAMRSIDENADPRAIATYIASLEGVRDVCENGLKATNIFFPNIELAADAVDLIAGNTANARRTVEQLEGRLREGYYWREEATAVLAAIAWRISIFPDCVEIARQCFELLEDSAMLVRIRPFVEELLERMSVAASMLRVTHPTVVSGPAVAGARLNLMKSLEVDLELEQLWRQTPAPSARLLDMVLHAKTRSAAFQNLACDVPNAFDWGLTNCSQAIVTVSTWWP